VLFLVSGVHVHWFSAMRGVESLKQQQGANSFVRFKKRGCYGIGGGEYGRSSSISLKALGEIY